MATPQSNLNQPTATDSQEFMPVSIVEVTAEEKGPSLPDAVSYAIPARLEIVKAVLAAAGITEEKNGAVVQSFVSAMESRPAAFLVLTAYPVPRGNEIDRRKARNVYGLTSGLDLPLADGENNRIKLTSLLFAQKKADGESNDGSKSSEAEKDLETKE